jgi:hypothetical protein
MGSFLGVRKKLLKLAEGPGKATLALNAERRDLNAEIARALQAHPDRRLGMQPADHALTQMLRLLGEETPPQKGN